MPKNINKKKYKDVSLQEIEKAVGDAFFEKTYEQKRKDKDPYVRDLGNGQWEIFTGQNTLWTNNGGKAMFDKAVKDWAHKELDKPEIKEAQDEEFKKDILYGK